MDFVNLTGLEMYVFPFEGPSFKMPVGERRARIHFPPTVEGDSTQNNPFLGLTMANVMLSDGSSFPEPVENVVYLASSEIRAIASAEGRTDVWGW